MKKTLITLIISSLLFPLAVSAQGTALPIPLYGNQTTNYGVTLQGSNVQFSGPSSGSAFSGLSACTSLSNFSSVAQCALGIINLIIPFIVALTVVWTVYSSFELARTEGDDRKKWGFAIFFGLLGIFLMISVYGLVAIFTGTFQFNGNAVSVPNLQNTIQYPTQ